MILLIVLAVLAVVTLVLLFLTFFTVKQQSAAIIERFGKYVRTVKPGLSIKVPFFEHIAQRVSLKVQPLPVEVETKTKDNVFTKVEVAVQYRVVPGSEADSYYKLQDHAGQIRSYVLDVVRSKVPKMNLDEVFEKKDEIGDAVKAELDAKMKEYGFEIPNALVTNVDPAEGVKDAMNEIQKQTRLQQAATAEGEKIRIIAVKKAEAEKETKKLAGEGIAAEREAIAKGIAESARIIMEAGHDKGSEGSADVPTPVSAEEAMKTLLLTQYFDTMKSIGTSDNAKTVFLPHSPGGMAGLMQEIAQAVMVGGQVPQPARSTAPVSVPKAA